MPKPYTCPCGTMAIWYPTKTTVAIRGGWIYGNDRTFAVCIECNERKRIGYDIELYDKHNVKFHPQAARKPHGKTATRGKARKPNKDTTGNEVWRFVD